MTVVHLVKLIFHPGRGVCEDFFSLVRWLLSAEPASHRRSALAWHTLQSSWKRSTPTAIPLSFDNKKTYHFLCSVVMSRLLFWCTALFASPFLWPNTNPETSNKLYYPALTESIMLLCWALDNGLDNQEYVSCLIAEKGHLELLKQAHCKGFPVNMTTLNLAENGQFEVLKWAQEGRYMLLNRHLFSSAAKGGHLDILKWLKDLGCRIEANEACGYAAEHGHLEMLCWLFEARADCELSADLCAKAAANGHLDVLKWLREKGFAWDEYTCLYAAKSRHFGGSKIRHKAWMSRARRSRAWAYINEHEEVWEWILELMH